MYWLFSKSQPTESPFPLTEKQAAFSKAYPKVWPFVVQGFKPEAVERIVFDPENPGDIELLFKFMDRRYKDCRKNMKEVDDQIDKADGEILEGIDKFREMKQGGRTEYAEKQLRTYCYRNNMEYPLEREEDDEPTSLLSWCTIL